MILNTDIYFLKKLLIITNLLLNILIFIFYCISIFLFMTFVYNVVAIHNHANKVL